MRPARTEDGTITLWVLGLCLCVLFLGGLSLDLWRGITVRRELQQMADSAAIAGGDGLDEASLRAGGVALDPARVQELANQNLALQSDARRIDGADVTVAGNTVVVNLRGHVPVTLLGVFLGGQHFDIAVHATATPQRQP